MDLAGKQAGLQQTSKHTQQTVKQCPHINCQMNRNQQLSSILHHQFSQSIKYRLSKCGDIFTSKLVDYDYLAMCNCLNSSGGMIYGIYLCVFGLSGKV